ncbi:type VII secretion integral membrane protein EccD [Streptomyces sp. NPDC006733]|uniref:type VII secretion integral membrane protein EccD n=1 Tax=Streptomyces sp. NPDC006733 TaxID=3155460 RepID=UPI00340A578A
MADKHCRVTVVGTRKRVDLAVPAAAPIAEYVTTLAHLCGEEELEELPAAWSLALVNGRTLHPVSSLGDAGVVDGQLLYLRDAAEGEFEEPLVRDLDEMIAEVADSFGDLRWTPRTRAATVAVLGAAWLAAACLVPAVSASWPGRSAGPLALGLGFVLLFTAWGLRRSGAAPSAQPAQPTLPNRLALPLALATVPCLAVAGWFLPDPSAGSPLGAALGAMVGAAAALGAVPSVTGAAVLVLGVAGAGVVGLLAALRTDLTEGAAAVAVAGYGMLLAAPSLAGRLAAAWPVTTEEGGVAGSDDSLVRTVVLRARNVLLGWTCAVSLVVAGCLAVLGAAHGGYAPALACCLAVALLLRAGTFRLLGEAVPVVLCGAAGLFSALLAVPATTPAPEWAGPVAVAAAGAVLLGTGAALAFRRPGGRTERPKALRAVAGLCSVAAIPLAIGVFGVFQHLTTYGHHL